MSSKPAVLIFGDSNTWGYDPDCTRQSNERFPLEERWVTRTGELLGGRCTLINEGLNGRTTVHDDVGGLPGDDSDRNGSHLLMSILHTHKPLHVVVLALGTNDLKSGFKASAADIANGVKTLINIVNYTNGIGYYTQDNLTDEIRPKILVLGPPEVFQTELSKTWGIPEDVNATAREASHLISILCAELGCDFLNMGDVVKLSERDGIHFTLAEQPLVAEAVADKLKEMLKW